MFDYIDHFFVGWGWGWDDGAARDCCKAYCWRSMSHVL